MLGERVFLLNNRVKARIAVLVLMLVALSARMALSAAARVTDPPPTLLDEQIVPMERLTADSCTAAIIRAHSPDAEPLPDDSAAMIDARLAARISDRFLPGYTDTTGPAMTTEPLLLSAQFDSGERLVWGQLWLPADDDGGYDDHEAVVVYVDDTLATPLLMFTDIEVRDPVGTSGCREYTPFSLSIYADWVFTALLSMGVALISVGLVADYRTKAQDFSESA